MTLEAEVASDPAALSFRWDFGDGSDAAFQAQVVHVYRMPGEYPATCTVRGPEGEIARSVLVKVLPPPIEVEIDVDPDIGYAPLTVRFAALADSQLTDALAFEWRFGDGGVAAGPRVTHVYEEPGQYAAVVVVTTDQGQSVTRDVIIQVDPREPGAAP